MQMKTLYVSHSLVLIRFLNHLDHSERIVIVVPKQLSIPKTPTHNPIYLLAILPHWTGGVELKRVPTNYMK